MAEILKEVEFKIQTIELIPSDGGKFEIAVDGRVVYSKLQTGRHVEPGEAARAVVSAL